MAKIFIQLKTTPILVESLMLKILLVEKKTFSVNFASFIGFKVLLKGFLYKGLHLGFLTT